MKKLKIRINILLIVAAAGIFAAFSWPLIASPLSEPEEGLQENSGFAEAQRLKGRWIRQDGGYTVIIENIKPEGCLKASYVNPRKINVSRASWKYEDNRIHIFIELRDANYPGSTYKLLYAADQDLLIGTYFQAVHKQTYNVSFKRMTDH
jgi:hypothetical protein